MRFYIRMVSLKMKENALQLLQDKRRVCICLAAAMLLIGIGLFHAGRAVHTWNERSAQKGARYTVVIDPGHGGFDPGKIGINGVYEKDINLAIAKELKEILEQNDCKVVMTRTEDTGLYAEGESNRKIADLRKRCEVIDSCQPDVVISVHQNSFSQESSKGAQVFYQTTSKEGKELALLLQKQMVASLDPKNHRTAKANSDYYMLKNTAGVMVIVECGFLSNSEEAELLCREDYQRKVAWAIALGTMQYLEGNNEYGNLQDRSGELFG